MPFSRQHNSSNRHLKAWATIQIPDKRCSNNYSILAFLQIKTDQNIYYPQKNPINTTAPSFSLLQFRYGICFYTFGYHYGVLNGVREAACFSMVKEPELINVLIVEADPIQALGLSVGLQQYGYAVAGIAGGAAEADLLFKEQDVDVMVINLQGPDDRYMIDIVPGLMKIKRVPVIYLVAGTVPYTVSSIKRTWPVALLSKPYNTNSVCMAIEIAVHNFLACRHQPDQEEKIPALRVVGRNGHEVEDQTSILRQGTYIFIKRNFQFVKLHLGDILYMEADGNYVHIVTKNKKFTIRLSLLQVLQSINYSRFSRINRSVVVNIDAIESFNKEQVCIDKYEFAIGKNYKESFFRHLGFH
jgi:DNA-binding LytR/AlgR family response regulator